MINISTQTIETQRSIDNYTSTITDVLNDVMGSDSSGFSSITLDNDLSNIMTKFFTNTRINVYVYQSKLCRVLTYPGNNEYSKPEYMRASVLPINDKDNYVKNHIEKFRKTERITTFWSTFIRDGGFSKLTFNPSTKKFSINLDQVTIYITSAYINLLIDENEIIAVLLHEVGCNLMLGRDILIQVISKIVNVLSIIGFVGKSMYDITNGTFESSVLTSFVLMLSVMIFTKFASIYFLRKSEMYMDEFVIKCGYGSYLESAIKKYHQYVFDYNSQDKQKVVESFNFVDKITQGWDRLGAKIMNVLAMLKLSRYQERTEREEMIRNKTDIYDTSDSNIERSGHI